MRKIWVVMRLYKHALEVKLENVLRYCNFHRAKMKRSLQWSMRFLLLVGLLCAVFGFLILTVTFLMEPRVKRPQIVAQRIRLPIVYVEKEEEPSVPGLVGKKEREEKPLEGDAPNEGKPMVSKSPKPSTMILKRGLVEKVVLTGRIEEDEKTQAGIRGYKDMVFRQEFLVKDIKIAEKIPERISMREERTTSEIQEKSVKGISQSHVILPDRVKLQRERGAIEAIPTRISEREEKSIGFSYNEEMAEGKRAERVEEKTARRDMVGDEKAISPIEASSPFIKCETGITAQKPVPEFGQLKHTKDLKDPNTLSEYDASNDLSDESISVARPPIWSGSSIEGEDRNVQSKLPTPIATDEEVRQFLVYYRERYSQMDRDGFLLFFSSRAVQNGKNGFNGIKKIYSDFFDQSEQLRYHLEDTRIDIYQNFVEVRGRYEVDQILKKRGEKKVWRGDIRWILVRENGAVKIRYLDYRPQKSP